MSTCDHCKFYDETPGGIAGACRRYAPRPTDRQDAEGDDPWAYWPKVAGDEWCGEWVSS